MAQQIVKIAQRVKEDIQKYSVILLSPLNVDDVSLELVRRIIPPSLYWLVCVMIMSDDIAVDDLYQPSSCVKAEDAGRVLSIAQDIIHCASNSRVKFPKTISLAMTVRHLTGSKQLVVLLNRIDHSSSYMSCKMFIQVW